MKRWTTPILILLFLMGLSLLLYPTVSNYWNARHQSRLISNYADTVSAMDTAELDRLLAEAEAYNRNIKNRTNPYLLSETEQEIYVDALDVGGTGIMGHIEIPAIGVTLPIYHGTAESVLQIAAGHVDWTALPVGGEGTHCVLSGHRGLPSAKLFTDLDRLKEGDEFMLRVLNEVLTYEIDQILIVLPNETGDLLPVPGEDYCTLVTCTPYGVNSHRMLVRGHRVENTPEAVTIRVVADAIQIEPVLVAPVVAMPMLLLLAIILFASPKPRKGKTQTKTKPKSKTTEGGGKREEEPK